MKSKLICLLVKHILTGYIEYSNYKTNGLNEVIRTPPSPFPLLLFIPHPQFIPPSTSATQLYQKSACERQ